MSEPQAPLKPAEVVLTDERLREILLKGSYVTEEDVVRAEAYAKSHRAKLTDFLLQEHLLTKDLLGQAIAESFGVPYGDLNSAPPKAEVVQLIPEEIAKKFRAVVFKRDKGVVTLATDHPENAELKPALAAIFKDATIEVVYSLSEDIDASFTHYQKALDTRFSKIIEKNGRVAPEILEEIFDDALSYRASDIHFEPQGDKVVVRFRVDGLLKEAGNIPAAFYENVLNRVKVQSRLRIDEHYKTQDGSLRYEKGPVSVDMRTSIVPTVEGEKIVLRVLASYIESLSLSDLGLSVRDQQLLQEMSEKPFGMILVTGPTGSGKTTTLYALLRLLNQPDVNITTIEDPVEYKTRGINQIQVNTQAELTFASGLRSIVRQDPDIILVGEIRDGETADIAVNAALTGHLVLSTFHANDAVTSLPRLVEMDVEPFLVASTLQVIVAQRLVRKICESCRYSVEVRPEELKGREQKAALLIGAGPITLYRGKGCDACGQSGYKGRTALFELITVTPALQDLILARASAQQLWSAAREGGARSMFEDGLTKVQSGATSLEELVRVVEPPVEAKPKVSVRTYAKKTPQ